MNVCMYSRWSSRIAYLHGRLHALLVYSCHTCKEPTPRSSVAEQRETRPGDDYSALRNTNVDTLNT